MKNCQYKFAIHIWNNEREIKSADDSLKKNCRWSDNWI